MSKTNVLKFGRYEFQTSLKLVSFPWVCISLPLLLLLFLTITPFYLSRLERERGASTSYNPKGLEY